MLIKSRKILSFERLDTQVPFCILAYILETSENISSFSIPHRHKSPYLTNLDLDLLQEVRVEHIFSIEYLFYL